jgi:hypothetical protein
MAAKTIRSPRLNVSEALCADVEVVAAQGEVCASLLFRVSQTAVFFFLFFSFFVSGSQRDKERDTRVTQATPLLSRSPTANHGQKCTESHKRREREMCKASISPLQHECRSVAKRVERVQVGNLQKV